MLDLEKAIPAIHTRVEQWCTCGELVKHKPASAPESPFAHATWRTRVKLSVTNTRTTKSAHLNCTYSGNNKQKAEDKTGEKQRAFSVHLSLWILAFQHSFGKLLRSSDYMGRMEYLAMKTDDTGGSDLIASDLRELGNAVKRLATHATKFGGIRFGTTLLKWIASLAAIGEVGKWIAFCHVVLRLFFPRHFPDCLEMPGSLILLLVVAPHLFTHTFRESWIGTIICLAIGCYLLQEHIRASGGFRNSFTQTHGVSNTTGIILLLVYPIWRMVLHFT
ncbi:hypothetical protein ACLOJK_002941 [Asimina triloba]